MTLAVTFALGAELFVALLAAGGTGLWHGGHRRSGCALVLAAAWLCWFNFGGWAVGGAAGYFDGTGPRSRWGHPEGERVHAALVAAFGPPMGPNHRWNPTRDEAAALLSRPDRTVRVDDLLAEAEVEVGGERFRMPHHHTHRTPAGWLQSRTEHMLRGRAGSVDLVALGPSLLLVGPDDPELWWFPRLEFERAIPFRGER